MSDELDELTKLETLTASLNARPRREKLLAMARGAARLDPEPRRHAVLALIRLAATPDVTMGPHGPVLSDALANIVPEFFEAAYGDAVGVEYWDGWLDYGEDGWWADLLATHYAAEMVAIDPHSLRASPRAQAARWHDILAGFDGVTLRAKVDAIHEHREKRAFLPESLVKALWPPPPENATTAPAENVADNVAKVPADEVFDFLLGVASKDKIKADLKAEAREHFKPRPLTDIVFEKAYQKLTPDLKRAPGETNKTLAALSRTPEAPGAG